MKTDSTMLPEYNSDVLAPNTCLKLPSRFCNIVQLQNFGNHKNDEAGENRLV